MANQDYLIDENDPRLQGLQKVQRPPASTSAGQPPDIVDRYQGGVVSGIGLQPDTINSQLPGHSPTYRLMPASIAGNPATNAAIQSTSQKVVDAAIANLPPSTPATPVSDGLIHGDAVWEYDSAFTLVRDDFMYGQTASAAVGETRWQFAGTGVAKTYIGNFNNPGILQLNPNSASAATTTSSPAANIFPLFGAPNTFWDATWPLFDYPGWKMTWVFGLSRGYNPKYGGSNSGMAAFSLTKMSMYVGMANDSTTNAFIGAGRPPIFFGCRFDTDTTAPAISDSTFWLEATMNPPQSASTRNNIQGTNGGAFNTGITPVEGKFYRLDMVYTTAGQLTMTLSGNGATATHTFTLTQMTSLWKLAGNVPVNSNGITNVNLSAPNTFSTTNGYLPQAPGSVLTMSTWGTTDTPLNGTFTILQSDATATPFIFTPAGFTTPVTQATATLVGYPSVLPMAILANSTEAGPVNNTRALNLDFFSFVINGVNGGLSGATTINSLNSRYFN